jgi:hypothetical protein
MTRQATTSASARPKRTPIGTRNILSVEGKEDGYVYRIVNDEGDRIQKFIDGGYEIVNASDVRVGDKRVNSATPEGTKAQVAVGGNLKAYVMRIREEWYKEDQATKQEHVNKLEQSLKQPGSADYGKVTIER